MVADISDLQRQVIAEGVLEVQSPVPHIWSLEIGIHSQNRARIRKAIKRSSGKDGPGHACNGGVPVETARGRGAGLGTHGGGCDWFARPVSPCLGGGSLWECGGG